LELSKRIKELMERGLSFEYESKVDVYQPPTTKEDSYKKEEIEYEETEEVQISEVEGILNELEIEALVDETEIGNVKVGLPVSFSVGAFPNKTFGGKVRQIRLNPQTIQNIVNYTVVIKVDEKEKNLLAGMTASIDIVIESKENVLKVPSTALRFQPSKDMLPQKKPDHIPSKEGRKERKSIDKDVRVLWVYDKNTKEIKPLAVKTGLSDGKNVEIIPVKDENIEGLEVIIASITKDKKQTTTNPMMFGPQPPRR
ncbi:TPA: HlyD family efflux transporter periplasmic adaptor subunit, partial [bacterium]|nr:HlyD family efflux transporter periplasmic adaptor subunit [bacterium]